MLKHSIGIVALVLAGSSAAMAQVPQPKPDRPAASAVPETAGNVAFSVGAVGSSYPPQFTAAANADEITTETVIPPCDPDFGVCLFYSADTYAGTNYESAGLRIQQRDDLATEAACLSTQPTGYQGLVPTTTEGDGYTIAEFDGIGDAGMGHYSSGVLYRLAWNGECYEFETRIAATQFSNYTPGTIQEFTDADQAAIKAAFQAILEGVTLRGGTAVTFLPQK